ncbi:MAG: hypothetical protein AAF639_27290 [Chloroflexota bacterium]
MNYIVMDEQSDGIIDNEFEELDESGDSSQKAHRYSIESTVKERNTSIDILINLLRLRFQHTLDEDKWREWLVKCTPEQLKSLSDDVLSVDSLEELQTGLVNFLNENKVSESAKDSIAQSMNGQHADLHSYGNGFLYPMTETRSTNHQGLMKFMEEWYARPNPYDDAWWAEFDADLVRNRF